jgi:hypothetical protein
MAYPTYLTRSLIVAVFVSMLVFSQLPQWMAFAAHRTIGFLRAGGDYQALREAQPGRAAAHAALRWLPAGAEMDATPQDWTETRVAIRYDLAWQRLPRLPNPDWQFFLDTQRAFTPTTTLASVEVADGRLYFRNSPVASPADARLLKTRTVLFKLAVFWAVTTAYLAVGVCVRGACGLPWRGAGALGSAYLLGFTVVNVGVWVALLLLVPLTRATLAVMMVVSLVLPAALWAARQRSAAAEVEAHAAISVMGRALAVITLITGGLMVVAAVTVPVQSWDAMSHWIYKSKVLFQFQTLQFDNTHHNPYPLLWSVGIASILTWLGSFADELAQWTVGVLIVCFLTQLYAGLRATARQRTLVWAAMTVFLLYAADSILCEAYAETLFLALLTGTATALLQFVERGHRGSLALAALLTAGLITTKLEGMPTALILWAGFAAGFPRRFLAWRAAAWVALGILLPTILVWGAWPQWLQAHSFSASDHIHRVGPPSMKGIISATWIFATDGRGLMAAPLAVAAGLLAALLGARVTVTRYLRPADVSLSIAAFGCLWFVPVGVSNWEPGMLASESHYATVRLWLHALPLVILAGASLACGLVAAFGESVSSSSVSSP